MQLQQPIVAPFGITVFGSAIVRTVPDVAVIRFWVSEVKPHPKEAFQAIREASQRVQTFLSTTQVEEAGSSHISLREEYSQKNNERHLLGYRTSVEFQVILSDLHRLEEILTGIGVDFRSSHVNEMRTEVRTQAILAAREKAEIYCKAARVELGEVIRIEDVNPDYPQRNEGRYVPEESVPAQAFDPTSIALSGAVLVTYKFQE
jgi:uncharacterized protein YggE